LTGAVKRHGVGIPHKSRAARRINSLLQGGFGLLAFLKYFAHLRLAVLLGQRRAEAPLGLLYRWRLWQYRQHVARLKSRAWQG
jgi:hypothetical protein